MAHPRSRGENPQSVVAIQRARGSSPLTRGKPPRVLAHTASDGLIPAHAGKTPSWRPPRSSPPAHPRSRGENSLILTGSAGGCGSSPLTRGKPPLYSTFTARRRLIPAHAGKTPTRSGQSAQWAAHPRSRGENSASSVNVMDGVGSSPLTRGKPPPGSPRPHLPRLIPAHAGKTLF